jgi:hypothetical protein
MDSVKTTVDIPEEALKDAMRFAKAKTKREAILTAIEEYNHRKKVERFLEEARGAIPDIPELEEIRDAGLQRNELLEKLWHRKK